MRCELTDHEGDTIKPMRPNKPRDPPPRRHQEPQQLHRCAATSSLRFRSRKPYFTLGTKDVAVKAGNPATPTRGDIEVTDSGMDVRSDAIPIKFRIFIDQVGGRFVAKLFVQTNFLKFVEERIGLFQIVRVAQVGR